MASERVNGNEFLLGLNYWPRNFVRMWADFDPKQIDRDFAAISGIGLKLVRMFVFWPDFQPRPDTVDERQLRNLGTVFDIAERHHLQLMPALITGHMSGPNWIPWWAMSQEENNRPFECIVDGQVSPYKPRDMYDDEGMIEAQKLLMHTVVSRFRDRRALWGWDLCNEVNWVQLPDVDQAERWIETMSSVVRAADADHPVTAGVVTMNGSGRGFQSEHHRLLDVASEHAYAVYDPLAESPTDAAYVGRKIEEARDLGGVPVMLQEFGMPNMPGETHRIIARSSRGVREVQVVDEVEAGKFVRNVLPIAKEAGAVGALIWCYTDYDPSLYGEYHFVAHPHERYFGIFGADGRLKPTGEAMRDFAKAIA